jgi:ligand-binding SRPBCC domain-containing protein
MRKLQQGIVATVSPQAVWKVLARFGNVEEWAPGIRRCRLVSDQATGVGTRRVIRHAWGFRIDESVTKWNEGQGMAFELLKAPFPMKNTVETWEIAAENGGTRITTTVSYDMGIGPLGALLDLAFVRFVVEREMRRGLEALVAFIEEEAPPAEQDYHPELT